MSQMHSMTLKKPHSDRHIPVDALDMKEIKIVQPGKRIEEERKKERERERERKRERESESRKGLERD